MSLPAGARFGPYEILAPIGAGGMGEVYRARDTSLHRFVAIKVLPDSFARDPERIARLRREAQTLASLNDPNIAAIFGFQDEGGRHALVLELVEGPTLADRIARGPLPVAESLAIARQIAKALDAAHQQGIVHRDLKPANIKVRDDGTVKVLDFGLSKAFEAGSAPDGSATPTITSPAVLTGAGMIIGTAAYMSPEQAQGLAADKRADIWAFGCVFYEMLTGRRAFDGAGVTETLAGVLRGEPNWALLPADLPAATRTLLTRCLEKDRRERVQDISTAKFVLAEQATLSGLTTRLAAPRGTVTRSGAWIALAALLGVAAGGTAIAWLRRPADEPITRTARFELPVPLTAPLAAGWFGGLVAIAPDASSFVYTVTRDGVSMLMLRRLDRLEATPIAGTESSVDPFFSPDGRQIGFVAANELKRIALDGGPSTTIWRADPTFEGASWCADGTIVFSQDSSLFRVDASGGQATKIASPDTARDEMGYNRPVVLPGGDIVIYSIEMRGGQNRVAARRLSGGAPVTLIEGGFGAQYLPPGYLVFAQADRLMAVRFNSATLQTEGSPVVLEQGVLTNSAEGLSNAVIAADGSAAFVLGRNSGSLGRPIWVDRTGVRVGRVSEQPLDNPRNVRLSPDGRRLALTIGLPGQGNIWVYDLTGATQPLRLTFRDHNTFPVWSPDGRRIAFMTVSGGTVRNFVIPADGSAVQPQPLPTDATPGAPMDWSPHETALLLYQKNTLWLVRPPDPRETEWVPSPFSPVGARFSPDGRWVAYSSTQSGRSDVWVRAFSGNGAPVRVSPGGGHEPVWSRDGKELFYTDGPKRMAARVLALDPEPRFDQPRVLFQGGFVFDQLDPALHFYDVAPDGRFLIIEAAETSPASLVIAQHWAEELKGRLVK